jgi:hydrogenase maturation protease
MKKGRVAVIGVGNLDRGDDAAGRQVARRLREAGGGEAEIVDLDGEATSILTALEKAEVAFLIDACISRGPAGAIHRYDLIDGLPAAAHFGLSSHGFGLAEAIELAKTLGQLPTHSVVYAIGGECFDIGAPLSDAVAHAVEEVAMQVAEEIRALKRSA